MSDIIIGIDLGTTNSEVAIYEQGSVKVLTVDGKKVFPSAVGFAEDDSLLLGQAALNQYLLYPERTVKSVKRAMGSDTVFDLAGVLYRPQEISAIILQHLKHIAQLHAGSPINKAVITVPAYFSDVQRQATRQAGELAGLEIVRIINEPTAAALAYGVDATQNEKILVYDLGGGTFDVSIVNIAEGVIEVLASHGNNQLGGDDFDVLLVTHIVQYIKQQYQVDVSKQLAVMARIQQAAEVAKINLSLNAYSTIQEEFLFENDGEPIHLSLEISRMQYESMIAEYLQETMEAVHYALKDAGLLIADINRVILVGGASRTPLIHAQLQQVFGFAAYSAVDPELCVAMGAAIQAALIAGHHAPAVLLDVSPYTYGSSAVGSLHGEQYPYVFYPIIRKNATLPISQQEAFETIYDAQDNVQITIYQGEAEDALENTEIGKFTVTGLQKVPAGNIIVLTLHLDINGILQVSALEKASGLQKSITIDNVLMRQQLDGMQSAKQKISDLFDHNKQATLKLADSYEQNAKVQEAAAMDCIKKAESLYDGLSEEDKHQIAALTSEIKQNLQAGEYQKTSHLVAELQNRIVYFDS